MDEVIRFSEEDEAMVREAVELARHGEWDEAVRMYAEQFGLRMEMASEILGLEIRTMAPRHVLEVGSGLVTG